MAQAKTHKEYIEGIGRRKTAVARVRITEGGKGFVINEKSLEDYFPQQEYRRTVEQAFEVADMKGAFGVSVQVSGGGITAQAEAIRHGVARALVKHIPELRKKIKVFGYLTRDPRMVERKKYGLKKARKAPQWSKR